MSYSFFYIDESYREEWESLAQTNLATGFMQSFAWAQYRRTCGWKTYKIGMRDASGKFIGGCIAMKYPAGDNYNYLYIPNGPVLPWNHPDIDAMFDALISEVIDAADTEGDSITTHLRVDPLIFTFPKTKHAFQKSRWFFEPEISRLIDLRQSEEEILAQMTQKGRYNIRLAEKKGVRVYEDSSPQAQEIFIKLYEATKLRAKYDGKSRGYFDKLIPMLAQNDMGMLLFAEHEGTPLAGVLYVIYGDRCIYFHPATADEKRELMPNYLVIWEAMKLAKSRGCKIFDFWGVAYDEDDESDDWYGFSQFKKKFGGKRVVYCGTQDLVFNKELYQRYLKENGESA